MVINCASQAKQSKPLKFRFKDQELAAWIGEESTLSSLDRTASQTSRPPWASRKFINPSSAQFAARVGYAPINNRDFSVLSDSLTTALRNQLLGDIETRVTKTTVDSLTSVSVQAGDEKDWITKHFTEVITVHYSPEVPFAGIYDHTGIWIDSREDTLWMKIGYEIERYRLEEQKKLNAELRKWGQQAYTSLKESYNAFINRSDVPLTLRHLGEASYYISRGGGLLDTTNLFQTNVRALVLEQQEKLIEAINEEIQLKLRDSGEPLILEPGGRLNLLVQATTAERLRILEHADLRVEANSDLIRVPQDIRLSRNNSAEINLDFMSTSEDLINQEIEVIISLDIYSPKIQQQYPAWEQDPYRIEMLSRMPSVVARISLREFQPKTVWSLVELDIPIKLRELNAKLLRRLEGRLARYSEFVSVVPNQNWPVSYDKFRRYRAGLEDLTPEELEDVAGHDVEAILSISPGAGQTYDLDLSMKSPKLEGILLTSLESVPTNDLYKGGIDRLVDKFFKQHFLRTIRIDRVPKNSRITVNGITSENISWTNNNLQITDLPRFSSLKINVKRPDYRVQEFSLNRESFDLFPEVIRNVRLSSAEAEREFGTLKVTVVDSLSGMLVRHGKPPKITVQRRILFFPIPFTKRKSINTSTATFAIDRIGNYYVSVSKQFYSPPMPRTIKVYDDLDPLKGKNNDVRFALVRKDPKFARILSGVFPGFGQIYLGQNTQGIAYLSTGAVLLSWFGYEYLQYRDYSSTYSQKRSDYENLGSDQWADAEAEIDATYEQLKASQERALIATSCYLGLSIFNVITIKF